MSDFSKYNMHHDGPDFGEDADVPMPDDPEFDAWIASAGAALNVPPATPALEMWAAIEAARRTSSDAQGGRIPGVRPMRRPRWFWPAAVAAALLFGVAIDRFAVRGSTERAGNLAVRRASPARDALVGGPAAPESATSSPAGLYRLAAVQTLTQAEALLTAYRASDVTTRNPAAARQLGTWGRDVLGSTRLLLDSPAGDDPQLRPLLNDIELVLVQIIRLSGAPLDSSDRALINRAMHDRDLLPRIRTAVPAGVAGAASDD